jgi:hypothetical protein
MIQEIGWYIMLEIEWYMMVEIRQDESAKFLPQIAKVSKNPRWRCEGNTTSKQRHFCSILEHFNVHGSPLFGDGMPPIMIVPAGHAQRSLL